MGKIESTLSLIGKENFLKFLVFDLHNVSFFPKINENKVVKFIGLERKSKGTHPKIIYPDGSIAPDNDLFPDFDKLDNM